MENYYYFYTMYSQKHIATWLMTESRALEYAQENNYTFELAN